MSKEEDTDVQSMITFGAVRTSRLRSPLDATRRLTHSIFFSSASDQQKALFEDEGTADITYTSQDVDELILRVEETEEEDQNEAKGMTFGFAKIWEASKAAEDEHTDSEAPPPEEDAGFWDAIVQRAAVEKQKEIEAMGRGAQRNRKRVRFFLRFDFRPSSSTSRCSSTDLSSLSFSSPSDSVRRDSSLSERSRKSTPS